jgi:hypothetical protein
MAGRHPPAFRYRARCHASQEAHRHLAAIRLARFLHVLGCFRRPKSQTRLKPGISIARHLIEVRSLAQHGRARLIAPCSGLMRSHTVVAP